MKQVMKQTAKDIIQKTRDFLGDDLFTIEGSNESDSFLINVLLRAKSLAKACYLRMQVHSRRVRTSSARSALEHGAAPPSRLARLPRKPSA